MPRSFQIMSIPVGRLLQQLGLRPLIAYVRYQLLVRSGAVRRRTPVSDWEAYAQQARERSPEVPPAFFHSSSDWLARLHELQVSSSRPAAKLADEILQGEFRLFGGEPMPLGFPPDWLRVPLNGSSRTFRADRHWTQIEYGPSTDLRLLWEPSRFGWLFTLGRAHWVSGDRRYAEGAWALLDSWRAANPPNAGPNWISGQEAGLRVLALSFGWFALQDWLQGQPERSRQWLGTIAAHAERIPPTVAYAQAQRNNHLISEAVGLYTAGLLFPQLRRASRWKAAGRRMLVEALADQVFADGGYIQHSINYHRLALGLGLWISRLAELNREPLPPASLGALRRMTQTLAALVDRGSGRAPNLGSNDGSEPLPLSGCAQGDFRPLVQAASLAFEGRRAFPAGPWDETASWLGLAGAASSAGGKAKGTAEPDEGAPGRVADSGGGFAAAGAVAAALDFPQAGLYLLRSEHSWAALRCARYTSRPSQSDQLQVDLWWQGQNIARDPGSYRYTQPGLEAARAHNAPVVDGRDPMRRLGRFLWVARWPAEFLGRWHAEDGRVESLAAEQRLSGGITHRRSLIFASNALYVVIDELAGRGEHQVQVAWLLPDAAWALHERELTLQAEPGELRLQVEPEGVELALFRAGRQVAGASQAGAEVDPTRGWWAPSYGHREPGLSLVATLRGTLPMRLASWWRLGEPDLALELRDGPLARFLEERQ